MVTLDRIRLTGLLRKKPRQRGFFYAGAARGARAVGDAGTQGTTLADPPSDYGGGTWRPEDLW
jgi:hypothetical protein